MKAMRIATTFFLFTAWPLYAAEYHVTTSGNDSNPGTVAKPWRSIAKANATLQPGDTVYVGTGEYKHPIKPANSGKVGQFITYAAAPGEKPALTDSSGKIAIVLDNRSFVKVDGFLITGKKPYLSSNLDAWASLSGASYNVIQNSRFQYAKGWNGIAIVDSAHHNKIINNRMDYVGTWSDSGTDKGDMIRIKDGASSNLIEGNHLTHGGHNLLSVESSHNVIRNNLFDNDWSDLLGSGKGARSVELKAKLASGVGFNLFEGNVVKNTKKPADAPTAMAMKAEGWNQIVRRNLIMNNAFDAISGVTRSKIPGAVYNRLYHNVLYGNGPAWRLQFYDSGYEINHNVFKNNIAYAGRTDVDIHFSLTAGGNPLFNNQVISNSFSGLINVKGIGKNSLSWYESKYPKNFAGNLRSAPRFVVAKPEAKEDFRLAEDSGLIDRGDFLTRTSGSGTGRVVTVKDARYFSDGFGIVKGDLIQIGNNEPVNIAKVDYPNNRITLEREINWNTNDGVSLPYYGTAPDIGAFEFGVPVAPEAPSNLRITVD